MPDEVLTLVYAPDGATVAVGGQTFHHVFKTSTGEKILELNPPSGAPAHAQPFHAGMGTWPSECVRSIVFSAGGKTIAAASGNDILLCDCGTGVVVKTLSAHDPLASTSVFCLPTTTKTLSGKRMLGQLCPHLQRPSRLHDRPPRSMTIPSCHHRHSHSCTHSSQIVQAALRGWSGPSPSSHSHPR